MSLFFRERRDLTLGDVFIGSGGSGGITFASDESALRVVAVYSAVAYIADSLATLPMSCYRGGPGTPTKINTPRFLAKPDPSISVFDWRYQLTVSLKLRGNAYGYVVGAGAPLGIVWLHPDRVHVDESGPEPIYRWGSQESSSYASGGQIIHLREFIQPGSVKGLSPIAHFRSTYETADLATTYGRSWFKNSSQPPGILKSKNALKAGQASEAKTMFMDATRDREPVVLGGDWDWSKITISPDEAQFLATIKATATMIAAIYRVSPEVVGGEAGSSRTYANRESDQELYNVRTLLPLATRVELALSELLPQPQFVKFNLDALNRPNLLERSRAYTENLRNGSLTLAEVRALENRPELTEAEIEFWQSNYVTQKSEAESISEAVSTSITQEA